jgi:hypothetical protein
MKLIRFGGEESARFSTFAGALDEQRIEAYVTVKGREPLTSRAIEVEGTAGKGVLNGYQRYFILREKGSEVEYQIAGSNSTRSIASSQVDFALADEDFGELVGHARATGTVVPGCGLEGPWFPQEFVSIDQMMSSKNEANARRLLSYLFASDEKVVREAALALRGFASVITQSNSLQADAEGALIGTLCRTPSRDNRVFIVEDLGYVGTTASFEPVSDLLGNANEDADIRWAAAIALGRLPARGLPIESLIQGLLNGLNKSGLWTKAAVLLSLSRRANPLSQDVLESCFVDHLSADKEALLWRYACLGLSRFERLKPKSMYMLRDVLLEPHTPADIRGYASMAILATLRGAPDGYRIQLTKLLQTATLKNLGPQVEPETMWGMEFIGDLASLLELHVLSRNVHEILSTRFNDWRAGYHRSISLYEAAEAEVRDGQSERAVDLLQGAAQELPAEGDLPHDARDAIRFRKDLVRARQQLNEIMRKWDEVVLAEDVLELRKELRSIIKIYARYSMSTGKATGVKQLAAHELQYIKNTIQLLNVLMLLLDVDTAARTQGASIEDIGSAVDNALSNLSPLKTKFEEDFAVSLNELVSLSIDNLEALNQYFVTEQNPSNKRRKLRAILLDLRTSFQRATWPMPARICPVFGLGKGVVRVLKEDLQGEGTEERPFLYPPSSSVILNVQAQIFEMVPGGGTRPVVSCQVSDRVLREDLPIVEGPYSTSFVIREPLSPVVSLRVTVNLHFEARDCNQIVATVSVYLRRSP